VTLKQVMRWMGMVAMFGKLAGRVYLRGVIISGMGDMPRIVLL